MDRTKIALLTIAMTTCVLSACATTDYHYSQILGVRYFKTPIDTYQVSVLRIDDSENVFHTALTDAGLHAITLQGPPGGTAGIGKVKTFTLDVGHCTRYYLVAVKSNQLDSDYSMKIDYQEPVIGCT